MADKILRAFRRGRSSRFARASRDVNTRHGAARKRYDAAEIVAREICALLPPSGRSLLFRDHSPIPEDGPFGGKTSPSVSNARYPQAVPRCLEG
jgi:hypothetical protein